MKYNIGDIVLIKTWKEMAENFKVSIDRDEEVIDTICGFYRSMDCICGTAVKITEVNSKLTEYRIESGLGKEFDDTWVIDGDMICDKMFIPVRQYLVVYNSVSNFGLFKANSEAEAKEFAKKIFNTNASLDVYDVSELPDSWSHYV